MYTQMTIPAATNLVASITIVLTAYFFITNKIGTVTAKEWRPFQVALEGSMRTYTPYIPDGRFLVEFYVTHQ